MVSLEIVTKMKKTSAGYKFQKKVTEHKDRLREAVFILGY